MRKQRDYFKKYGIFVQIFTDDNFENIEGLFDSDIVPRLHAETPPIQLSFGMLDAFYEGFKQKLAQRGR